MSTKHTPGPWNKRAGQYIYTETGQPIAHISLRTTPGEEEANARLIAAAPELLEATKNLLNMIKMCGLQSPPEWEEKIERTITAARTAVEKATSQPEPNPATDTWLTELIKEIEKRKKP